jgi:hypothetical protein
MSLQAFLAVTAIAQLRMDPVMARPTDQDLDQATGMVAPMDTAAGETYLHSDYPAINIAN